MKSTFFGIVILSIVLDVVLGAWASISWKHFAGFWFPELVSATEAPAQIIGLVLGMALLFFAALQGYAIQRIRTDNEDGYPIFFGFGGYLLVSAVISFVFAQNLGGLRWSGLEFLLLDGLRGVLIGTFAFLAMRAPATVTELKLPKRAQRVRRSAERSSDSRRRGGDERRSGSTRSSGRRGGRSRGGPERSDRGAEGGRGRGRGRRRRSGGSRSEGSEAGSSGANAPAA